MRECVNRCASVGSVTACHEFKFLIPIPNSGASGSPPLPRQSADDILRRNLHEPLVITTRIACLPEVELRSCGAKQRFRIIRSTGQGGAIGLERALGWRARR